MGSKQSSEKVEDSKVPAKQLIKPEHGHCPETKKAMDECVKVRGEAKCAEEIKKHKECMKKLGFNV